MRDAKNVKGLKEKLTPVPSAKNCQKSGRSRSGPTLDKQIDYPFLRAGITERKFELQKKGLEAMKANIGRPRA